MTHKKKYYTLPITTTIIVALACDANTETEILQPRDGSEDASADEPEEVRDRQADTAEAERATEGLAGAFAEVLQDDENKGLFLRAMDASHHPEKKVFLPTFLAEHRDFRNALARSAEKRGEDLDALLEVVADRGMEVYMPVQSHRELAPDAPRWYVGAQYVEENVPIGFDDTGSRVQMSLETPPLLPTVMIVPTESFDPMTGTLLGEFTVGVSQAPLSTFGLWVTESHIYDLHEPWTRGNPEIEVDVQHGGTRQTLACSEEDTVPEPRRFNQDGHNYYAPFLIATTNQLPDENFVVAFYEDDQTRCVIVEGSDSIKNAIDVIKAGYNLWANMDDQQVAVAIVNLWTALKKLFGGDDDFVGVIVGGQKKITSTPTVLQMGDKQAYESGWVKMKWGYDVAH